MATAAIALALFPSSTRALDVTVTQRPEGVEFYLHPGAVNLTGLIRNSTVTHVGHITPGGQIVDFAPTSPIVSDSYFTAADFEGQKYGTASKFDNFYPTASSGSFFTLFNNKSHGALNLSVPKGYISGDSLGESIMFFEGQRFADLTLIPGVYVWKWGTGENQSLTMHFDSDGDGVLDEDDACPLSDLHPTVFVGACDTGVANDDLIDGCSTADLVASVLEAAADGQPKNRGQFNKLVARGLNDLVTMEILTPDEQSAIMSQVADKNCGCFQ